MKTKTKDLNLPLFLSQLVYFGGLQDFTVDFIAKKYSNEEIKSFLEKEVREYKEEII